MRIIIDTSVVTSAAIRDRAPEELILLVVAQPSWQWIATSEILDEYLEVLARPKFGLQPDIISRWHDLFDQAVTVFDTPPEVDFARDPDDAIFVACALAADADLLVTGDDDLLALGTIGDTQVMTVRQALEYLRDLA